jgi:EAL domain-containing protein (putative c-di-GMP-specific phosphodiesterase class I)
LSRTTPDLIVLDVTTDGTNAVEVLHVLSQCAYPGILQLMSERGVSMVEPIRQLAQLHSIQVLPPLLKPIEAPVLRNILENLSSTVSQAGMPQIRLDDAINNGWIQFWYQPKVDLRTKTLVGLEAFVRLFHPRKGLIPPAVILKNADESSLAALMHHALTETGLVAAKLAGLGLKPTIAINTTLTALETLPPSSSFRDYIKSTGHQHNFIFDVGEDDVAKHLPSINSLGATLRSLGVRLAIDNFSGRVIPRSAIEKLPIAEFKLSPRFVAHCHSKSGHVDVCRALIDLAHDLRSVAVAIGVETAAQCQALQLMGCDVGQGFLFGHPLPLEQIIAMVRQRSAKDRRSAAALAG